MMWCGVGKALVPQISIGFILMQSLPLRPRNSTEPIRAQEGIKRMRADMIDDLIDQLT
jgi:hypothetical protein